MRRRVGQKKTKRSSLGSRKGQSVRKGKPRTHSNPPRWIGRNVVILMLGEPMRIHIMNDHLRLQAIVVQRQLEHSGGCDIGGCQCSPTEVARRFRAQLCRGDAAVDFEPPTGLAGSHHCAEVQNIPVDGRKRPIMACSG